jgi:geranylgeranyl pyrophosphate synthase
MNALQRIRLSDAFTAYMPLPATLEPHLKAALTRVLNNPGSLIRPQMVLEVALAYGLAEAVATDLAIAIEYFHTASLIFDDMPAMDDATERRGRACIHIDFGEAAATLAALALVNRAYALTWRAVAAAATASAAAAARQPRALQYVEQHLGVGGLLQGQSIDLHDASLPHHRRTAQRAALGKTVSLVRLTLVLPAMLGGASERELQLLERLALFWGLSYQIVDDLKDLLQSSSQSGKTNSRDHSLGRPNIALELGIDPAVERLQRLITLGDSMLVRLIALRPALAFLAELRTKLGGEAQHLTQSVYVHFDEAA